MKPLLLAIRSVKKPKELVISENVFEQNTSLDKFGFWD